jgi:septum formation protein
MKIHQNLLYNEIVLASASPQRSAILEEYGFRFSILPANIDEKLESELSPEQNAKSLARQKAEAIWPQHGKIVLGADTIVVTESGDILGKAKDKSDAQKMLRQKRGTTERVITGFCLISDEKRISGHEVSYVSYSDFSEATMQKILDSEEWKGVAGALRIEGKEMQSIITEITGDYQNIIGLPIGKIAHILRDFPTETKSAPSFF